MFREPVPKKINSMRLSVHQQGHAVVVQRGLQLIQAYSDAQPLGTGSKLVPGASQQSLSPSLVPDNRLGVQLVSWDVHVLSARTGGQGALAGQFHGSQDRCVGHN